MCVCLARRGTCSHTPSVCRMAGPWRTRWPFRLPVVRQLGQGEKERWRATNGALQVTHTYSSLYSNWTLLTRTVLALPIPLMPCLFWITVSALGLDGQVFWSPWKRLWLCWIRVSRCSHWTLSKHWEISELWWFRPRYRETKHGFMLVWLMINLFSLIKF